MAVFAQHWDFPFVQPLKKCVLMSLSNWTQPAHLQWRGGKGSSSAPEAFCQSFILKKHFSSLPRCSVTVLVLSTVPPPHVDVVEIRVWGNRISCLLKANLSGTLRNSLFCCSMNTFRRYLNTLAGTMWHCEYYFCSYTDDYMQDLTVCNHFSLRHHYFY